MKLTKAFHLPGGQRFVTDEAGKLYLDSESGVDAVAQSVPLVLIQAKGGLTSGATWARESAYKLALANGRYTIVTGDEARKLAIEHNMRAVVDTGAFGVVDLTR